MANDAFVDRLAIVDVAIQYHRAWTAATGSCTERASDPCEFDLSSWSGQPATVMAADDWVKKVRGTNGNFDTTQHLSTNHVVTLETPNEATSLADLARAAAMLTRW